MNLRELGDTRALELLVFQSENQELAGLAFDMVEGRETDWSRLIGNAAAAGISDEDMVEFEDEIAQYKKHNSQDAQAGSIIKTIQNGKRRSKRSRRPTRYWKVKASRTWISWNSSVSPRLRSPRKLLPLSE